MANGGLAMTTGAHAAGFDPVVRLWRGWWWLLRAAVASRYLIPRSSLEAAPEPWMSVMLDAARRETIAGGPGRLL